ncbi:MAG: putative dsRNA-binding protein, partial [Micrococcales bacterium]
ADADPKTTLVEYVQENNLGAIEYEISYEGPDHDRNYFCTVSIGNREIAKGEGRNKKTAETDAAIAALKAFRA